MKTLYIADGAQISFVLSELNTAYHEAAQNLYCMPVEGRTDSRSTP